MQTNGYPRALHELEQQFARLAPDIPDGPHKQALAVLHGITTEIWRTVQHDRMPGSGANIREIADLWQSAPPMEGAAATTGLPVGDPAPDFTLPDATGTPVHLAELRGRPVVLVFYPLDWSPGCSQQLDLYQQELDEFRSRGATVLAISPDSVYSHGAWAAVRGLSIPLLSDFHPHGDVARQYRVWRDGDGFSDRAVYVIDPHGAIAYRHVSPYLHHIPELDELLTAVDAARGSTDTEPANHHTSR
ncbi:MULTISPECIES: peroxiredoxin [unclassified Micromonospora]|uniref:peroxiredoxin n=1 Tax=unclassified Micromonospora TaxID=2617518 RepID=UPI002FF0175A